MKNSNWDLDYRAGLTGESKVADLLHLDTVEVKTDRRWKDTGNIYIETECYYKVDDAWKPSGIRVSKATHWAFVLEGIVLIIELYKLQDIVYKLGKAITCNIPPNPSRGYIIKPSQLIESIRQDVNQFDKAMEENIEATWSDSGEWEDIE